MKEDDIRELFRKHEVLLSRDDVWKVQGTPVIKHSALERLSAALKLTWDLPTVVRSERDECVVLARATRTDGVSEWSFGEALIVGSTGVGGNYKVSGKQASYVYAMGEKRAKDRVIIKLAGLYGAYSEEEADDFKDRSQRDRDEEPEHEEQDRGASPDEGDVEQSPRTVGPEPGTQHEDRRPEMSDADKEAWLRARVEEAKTRSALSKLITNKKVVDGLDALGESIAADIRARARVRMKEMGDVEKAARDAKAAETEMDPAGA